jgi:hypothetical protein
MPETTQLMSVAAMVEQMRKLVRDKENWLLVCHVPESVALIAQNIRFLEQEQIDNVMMLQFPRGLISSCHPMRPCMFAFPMIAVSFDEFLRRIIGRKPEKHDYGHYLYTVGEAAVWDEISVLLGIDEAMDLRSRLIPSVN